MRANIAGRRSTQVDILPPPGLENRFVEVRLEQDLDESWFGATWSKKLSPRVGIGVSPYVAVRSQRSRAQIVGQAMASDGSGAATITIRGFQFSNYRLLAKAGASFALEKVNLGLTLTTPGVKLFGSGDAGIDRYRVGQSSNGLGNLFTTGFEEGLSSEWKSPLSIGAGATVPMGSTTLYFTGEWYDQVDEFKVLDVGTVVDQVSGLPVPFEVVHQARSVTNGGIGLEHAFGPKFTGFASFSTDFSTADEGASDTALSNWDIYLVSGGNHVPGREIRVHGRRGVRVRQPRCRAAVLAHRRQRRRRRRRDPGARGGALQQHPFDLRVLDLGERWATAGFNFQFAWSSGTVAGRHAAIP